MADTVGIRSNQIKVSDKHGTQSFVQMSDDTGADGNLSKYSAGAVTDNGICYSYAADIGSANAYAVILSPTPTLVAGSTIVLKVAHANTGASTLAVSGGGAIAVKKESGSGLVDLASGDWRAGQIALVIHDGTAWQWLDGFSGVAPATTYQRWIAYDLRGQPPAGSLASSTAGAVTFVPIPGNLSTFQIAANFTGNNGKVGGNPTATAVYTFYKNGSSIGTLSISTGGVFTGSTSGGVAISFTPGTDELAWIPPAAQDATLSDVRFAIPIVIS